MICNPILPAFSLLLATVTSHAFIVPNQGLSPRISSRLSAARASTSSVAAAASASAVFYAHQPAVSTISDQVVLTRIPAGNNYQWIFPDQPPYVDAWQQNYDLPVPDHVSEQNRTLGLHIDWQPRGQKSQHSNRCVRWDKRFYVSPYKQVFQVIAASYRLTTDERKTHTIWAAVVDSFGNVIETDTGANVDGWWSLSYDQDDPLSMYLDLDRAKLPPNTDTLWMRISDSDGNIVSNTYAMAIQDYPPGAPHCDEGTKYPQ